MDNILIKLGVPGTVIISIFKLIGVIEWGWLAIVTPIIVIIAFDFFLYALKEFNNKNKK